MSEKNIRVIIKEPGKEPLRNQDVDMVLELMGGNHE